MDNDIAQINQWLDDKITECTTIDPKNREQVSKLKAIIMDASKAATSLQNSMSEEGTSKERMECWRRIMRLLLIDWYPKYDSILEEHHPDTYSDQTREAHRGMQSRFLKHHMRILSERQIPHR